MNNNINNNNPLFLVTSIVKGIAGFLAIVAGSASFAAAASNQTQFQKHLTTSGTGGSTNSLKSSFNTLTEDVADKKPIVNLPLTGSNKPVAIRGNIEAHPTLADHYEFKGISVATDPASKTEKAPGTLVVDLGYHGVTEDTAGIDALASTHRGELVTAVKEALKTDTLLEGLTTQGTSQPRYNIAGTKTHLTNTVPVNIDAAFNSVTVRQADEVALASTKLIVTADTAKNAKVSMVLPSIQDALASIDDTAGKAELVPNSWIDDEFVKAFPEMGGMCAGHQTEYHKIIIEEVKNVFKSVLSARNVDAKEGVITLKGSVMDMPRTVSNRVSEYFKKLANPQVWCKGLPRSGSTSATDQAKIDAFKMYIRSLIQTREGWAAMVKHIGVSEATAATLTAHAGGSIVLPGAGVVVGADGESLASLMNEYLDKTKSEVLVQAAKGGTFADPKLQFVANGKKDAAKMKSVVESITPAHTYLRERADNTNSLLTALNSVNATPSPFSGLVSNLNLSGGPFGESIKGGFLYTLGMMLLKSAYDDFVAFSDVQTVRAPVDLSADVVVPVAKAVEIKAPEAKPSRFTFRNVLRYTGITTAVLGAVFLTVSYLASTGNTTCLMILKRINMHRVAGSIFGF